MQAVAAPLGDPCMAEDVSSEIIHGDMLRRAEAHTAEMEWQASPAGGVWRKRVHLVGSAEAGQVSSIVRYDAGAEFPSHDHPGGEEILVLEGVFSDEHGHWPAGTYLLNPEGFRHAPFSVDGCTLFVKLRQFGGTGREHVVIDTRRATWEPGDEDGVTQIPLYRSPDHRDTMRMEHWAAGTELGERIYAHGVEWLILAGSCEDAEGRYDVGTWLRLPHGASHAACSEGGCELYIKEGGVAGLTTQSDALA